jgi:uncharacterized protein YecE (DUF72 family)
MDLKEFLAKISPFSNTNKLGAIIIQLPPSFTIKESKNLEKFLEALKNNSDIGSKSHYALEFRHNSWDTEGVLELLEHYNIASVLTDSPEKENLGFLSNEENVTSKDIGVVRLHGRNTTRDHYWYDYLYSEKELVPWVNKIKRIKEETDNVFVYFNNHYSGKAIVNALQFKEMVNDQPLSENENNALERARKYISNSV